MKNEFSNIKKAIMIIIEYLCAMAFVIGAYILLSHLEVANGEWENVNYFESNSFTQGMLQEVRILTNDYIPLREMYENINESDIVIDIARYSNGSSRVSENSLGLTYRLKDLKRWADIGITYVEFEVAESIEEYASIEDMDREEETAVAMHYVVEGILEEYAPIGYGSIRDYVAQNPNISYYEVYNHLIEAIERIGNESLEYEMYAVRYNQINTNLEYSVKKVSTGEVWTNTNRSQIDIKKLDAYLEINTVTLDLGSNFFTNRSELVNSLWRSFGSDEYLVTIGINHDLPIQDHFHYNRSDYERWGPWRNVALVLVGAGMIIGLISVIYLTCAAGRKGKNKEIQLNWFDKIKTEVFIAGAGIAAMSNLAILWEMLYYYYRSNYGILLTGILTLTLNTIAIISYLSFVKRIKAKTLWKNSMFYAIISWFNEGVTLGRVTSQILLKFGVYFFTIIFLVVAMGGFGAFLAFIISMYVLYVILNNAIGRRKLLAAVQNIAAGNIDGKVNITELKGDNLLLAYEINNMSAGLQQAVEKSLKDERLKTDLITNVSHDIKTPLTSIINYVDLIKRENIEDAKIKGYIEVLDSKSQRLKTLTEDLVEASKISSGNIEIILTQMNFTELLQQTNGEFDNKFSEKNLEIITHIPEYPVIINGDGRRIWRILENLYNNIHKYAMENTRVYISLLVVQSNMVLTLKNISKYSLNIEANELTERFIRGDVSRSTEGSGLGLAIAKNLTTLQGGTFDIYLDGDLFKATITFPIIQG